MGFDGRGAIFETWRVLLVGSKFCLTVCKRTRVLTRAVPKEDLCGFCHQPVSQHPRCCWASRFSVGDTVVYVTTVR